ncbi:zinc ribbon domain-containing protein [Actinocorallia sp. B10E7]|uniref:zinc ribbon domain-containing protein n=1 Tax=Actinocorallia sp. B10E7 TaxID=3153558 RepID=UPI00325CD553
MQTTVATRPGPPDASGGPESGVRRTRGANKAAAWRWDGPVSAWFRLWGRACAVFTPGMLKTALAAECAAVGGRLGRAATFSTALSQHCLCGQRTPKTLKQRVHRCPSCGLVADRDLVSAALGAFVTWTDPADPKTASVDFSSSRHALGVFGPGLQGALAESTATRTRTAPTGGGRRGGSRPEGEASARPHPERPRRRPRTGTHHGSHRTDATGHRTVSTSKQALGWSAWHVYASLSPR